jgi:hypothetical protein
MLNEGLATTGIVTGFEALGVVGVPSGFAPTTDAVFTMVPASRSAWVTVCDAEQVVAAPGASVATGQVIPVAFGSETVMFPIVTLPVLVTTKVYGMTVPIVVTFAVVLAFTIVRSGVCPAGTVTVLEATGRIREPFGAVPTIDAVFTIEPASRSAWVTVWVPEQVVETLGASVVSAQGIAEAFGSATAIPDMVTLPVLVTSKLYGTAAPTVVYVVAVVALTIDSAGEATTGTETVLEGVGTSGVPLGGVPPTAAVFTIEPASRSAWVTVCVAVQVVEVPGAKVVTGQVTAVVRGSVTAMPVMVTLPVLVTTKV